MTDLLTSYYPSCLLLETFHFVIYLNYYFPLLSVSYTQSQNLREIKDIFSSRNCMCWYLVSRLCQWICKWLFSNHPRNLRGSMFSFCESLIFFKSPSKSSLLTFLASSWSEWHRLWSGKLSLRDSALFTAVVWVVHSWVLLTYSINLYILFKLQLLGLQF